MISIKSASVVLTKQIDENTSFYAQMRVGATPPDLVDVEISLVTVGPLLC
jgi:hypothetical protein